MKETVTSKKSFKPRNIIGWAWLAIATFILVVTLLISVLAAFEPVNLSIFFYGLTYTIFSILLFVLYKMFHLKQESLSSYRLVIIIAILMGICMYLTNNL